MDVAAYLERIDYRGPTTPTPDTLRSLHRAHMLSVPFENLDIHLGRPIVLDETAFYDKIVGRRRGGFCYELNGLFAALLRALRFDVSLLSAAVWNGEGYGPDFDHMLLLVKMDDRWLADVGFGDSFVEPLSLDDAGDQAQGGRRFRIESDGKTWAMRELDGSGAVQGGYRFTLDPRRLSDYAPMCRYQQTSPDSHFTRQRICSLATPDGCISLSDMRLIATSNGQRSERQLASEAEYLAALKRHFDLVLSLSP